MSDILHFRKVAARINKTEMTVRNDNEIHRYAQNALYEDLTSLLLHAMHPTPKEKLETQRKRTRKEIYQFIRPVTLLHHIPRHSPLRRQPVFSEAAF